MWSTIYADKVLDCCHAHGRGCGREALAPGANPFEADSAEWRAWRQGYIEGFREAVEADIATVENWGGLPPLQPTSVVTTTYVDADYRPLGLT